MYILFYLPQFRYAHFASTFRVLRLLRFIPQVRLIMWTVVKSLEVIELMASILKVYCVFSPPCTDLSMGWPPSIGGCVFVCSHGNAGMYCIFIIIHMVTFLGHHVCTHRK